MGRVGRQGVSDREKEKMKEVVMEEEEGEDIQTEREGGKWKAKWVQFHKSAAFFMRTLILLRRKEGEEECYGAMKGCVNDRL